MLLYKKYIQIFIKNYVQSVKICKFETICKSVNLTQTAKWPLDLHKVAQKRSRNQQTFEGIHIFKSKTSRKSTIIVHPNYLGNMTVSTSAKSCMRTSRSGLADNLPTLNKGQCVNLLSKHKQGSISKGYYLLLTNSLSGFSLNI